MQNKREAILKLEKAILENKVDVEILRLLEIINSNNDFYTTSSCSGRIIVIELEEIGDKEGAEVLGKWHEEVEFEKVKNAIIKNHGKGVVYLMVQSPIFHVVCSNLVKALQLQKIAISSSFKYSSIKSIEKKGKVLIEILSSEQISAPICNNGRVFVTDEYLKFLVNEANITLKKAKEKLGKLYENIYVFLK